MRAIGILRSMLATSPIKVHKMRCEAVLWAVASLLRGRRLWLTALGRSATGRGHIKHQIKRADRLLGNPKLHRQHHDFYRPMVPAVIGNKVRPVIIVDWSGVTTDDRFHVLRAAVPVGGRTLTVYDEVHPRTRYNSPAVHKGFLKRLHALLPTTCRPIIVTDAGFRCPWFREVAALGWAWVGRVRNRIQIERAPDGWISSDALFKQATSIPTCLGHIRLTRHHPLVCRLIVVKHANKGRVATNRQGRRSRRAKSQYNAHRNSEPWLLVTCLDHAPAPEIVKLYAARMQIEESFRDLKDLTYGWGLARTRTRSAQRLQILILIAVWATLAAWLVGRLARQHRLDRFFQANTVRDHCVLSLVTLGSLIMNSPGYTFSVSDLRGALRTLFAAALTLDSL